METSWGAGWISCEEDVEEATQIHKLIFSNAESLCFLLWDSVESWSWLNKVKSNWRDAFCLCGQMSLHIFLEPCWLTEPHKNKTKDECMEMRWNKQCHWQMVVDTYFPCTKACKIEWDKIFQHSLVLLPASFKKNLQIFFVFTYFVSIFCLGWTDSCWI